jgi:hypothetical protein
MPAERALRFPNTDLAPRLVLFPISDGGVALEWLLDPTLIKQAQDAFAAHQPIAKLYLRRAEADGACLAEAVLAELSSHPAGVARFEAPVVGALQAELGFEGQRDGGWLLLARSNRLDAVPEPRRLESWPAAAGAEQASALSDAPSVDQVPPVSALREPGPETTRRSPGPGPIGAQLSAPAPHPQSLNRHSMLTPSASASAAAGVVPAKKLEGAVALDAENPRPARDWSGLSLATRFPDPSLVALSDRPELSGSAFPLVRVAHATSEVADDRVSQTANVHGASPPGTMKRLFQGNDLAPVSAADPVAEKASEQVLLDQEPPNRQDVAPLETPVSRGSGPLSPYPSGEGAMIQGELHVFGSAAPGSLLDLGGHPLRVGPGGRFSFRVVLDDADLLASLLARLPRLPVDERES